MFPAHYTVRLIDIKDTELFNKVLKNYDIFDEKYRDILNKKIINHYLYEEIGFEAEGLFYHYLRVRLDEIMPKYNLLYKSELLKLDPLSNFSFKETLNRKNEGNSNSSSQTNTDTSQDSSEKENHVYQNTPQGDLAHETIDNFSYATTHNLDSNNTNLSKNVTSNINDNTQMNSTEEYIKSMSGNSNISTARLFKEFINNFISIDKLIIDDLQDLFMGIF